MKFVEDVEDYKKSKEKAIQDKKDLVEQLKADHSKKLAEIKNVENEYKRNFDDGVFNKLTKLKVELDNIKSDININNSKLKLMDIGEMELDSEELKTQLNSFIEDLNLDEKRQIIITKKEEYLNSINVFIEELNGVRALKNEITSINKYITDGSKDIIRNFFSTNSSVFNWDKKFDIKDPLRIPADINYYKTLVDDFEKEIKDINSSISYWGVWEE